MQSSRVMKEGLDLDRRFMLIDNENKFLTIRQNSRLALIIPRFEDDGEALTLVVGVKNMVGGIRIPARPLTSDLKVMNLETVEIWGTKLGAHIFPSEVTSLLSEFLGQNVRIACHQPNTNVRLLRGNGSLDLTGRSGSVGYADVVPLQIASLSSLKDLNERILAKGRAPVSIEQFRPNIVVDDTGSLKPWDEDTWLVVSLITSEEGKLIVDIVSHCARCQVPNVDVDTAVKDKTEPWETLMKFRRVDEGITYKPCFGMLGVPRTEVSIDEGQNPELGSISVGDHLRIEDRTDKHRYISSF